MNYHYKVCQYSQIVYFFTTGNKTQEHCKQWIKENFDYLDFYQVYLNGEKIDEKKAIRLRNKTWGGKNVYG